MRMLLVLCMLAAAASTARADDKSDETVAVGRAIATQNAKYVDAVNKQDVTKFLALFTDDSTLIYSGKTVTGKAAREKAAKDQLAAVKDPTFKSIEVDARGDLAYEVGKYTVTERENGKTKSGTYLVVWKNRDGTWKIHVEATLPSEPTD